MDGHGIGRDDPVLQELASFVVMSLSEGMSATEFARALGIALARAASMGNRISFQQLENAGAYCHPSFRNRGPGLTLIGCATFGGNLDIIRSVLERVTPAGSSGADQINLTCGRRGVGVTPLHMAMERDAREVVMLLLEFGADPTALNDDGLAPLHMASMAGCSELLEEMVRVGNIGTAANTLTRSTMESPLHLAAAHGHNACVVTLLDAGVDKNKSDKRGYTALYLGVLHGHMTVVTTLLARGAKPNLRPHNPRQVRGLLDTEGLRVHSCLGLAAARGQLDMVNTLLSYDRATDTCANDATGIHFAVQAAPLVDGKPRDNSAVVSALALAGLDVNARLRLEGMSALHLACNRIYSSPATARALLDNKADPNAMDNNKNTPLHYACIHSLVDVVPLLLAHGAVELVNRKKKRPSQLVRDNPGGKQVKDMLTRATRWRNRGWVVMCRARAIKATQSAGGVDSTPVEEPAQANLKQAKASATEEGGGASADGEGAGGEEQVIDFARLVRWLIELESEDTFRVVMTFL